VLVKTTANSNLGEVSESVAGRELSSSSRAVLNLPAPVPDSDAERVLRRLQELLSMPARIEADLHRHFITTDRSRCGRIGRDAAVCVLEATSNQELTDLPVASIEEARWRSLLKRFGVYQVDDVIGFDELLQLYTQTIGTLRDWFAPPDMLRAIRKVARSSPRLKDRYDRFQFYSRDPLGKIYLCRDRLSKEARCCRQIRKDKASVPVDRIRSSLSRLQDHSHPRIPKVVEYLEDFHNFYIISVALEGVELMEFVQDSFVHSKGLTEGWIAAVMKEVLEAVAHCHSQPLGPAMHRDLAPESILLSPPGSASAGTGSGEQGNQPHVTVTGFGLRPLFDMPSLGGSLGLAGGAPVIEGDGEPTEAVPSCNLPGFLAPEVWKQDFGPRCDVWSCGCLMFLLLTGCVPFDHGLPVRELAAAVLVEEPDWRIFRHVSTSALSLCRRMLLKDDAGRPDAMECLRHPWFANPGSADRVPRELRPETVNALMHYHARSKFMSVLMNVVAMELQVRHLRRVRPIFDQLDMGQSGYLRQGDMRVALSGLGISSRNVDEVLGALTSEGLGVVSYGLFLAGCVDLVDDKLDHMLWKVFAMVDEDHSGEISVVELAHFLEAACGNTDSEMGDVEQYMRGVLDPHLPPTELVTYIAGDRDAATFEEVKAFVLSGAGSSEDGPLLGPLEAVEEGTRSYTPSTDD